MECFRVAYLLQNVGGIDLARDVGDAVPVKNMLKRLQSNGHEIACIELRDRSVVRIADVTHPNEFSQLPLGISGSAPFLKIESALRRLQRSARLPYFALFDSFRFYEACVRSAQKVDLCHEHHGLFGIGAALACKKLGIPLVLTFSADQLLEMDLKGERTAGIHRRWGVWGTKFSLGVARKVICVSSASKQNLVDNWGVEEDKIEVLPNGVDLELFGSPAKPAATRQGLGLVGGPIVVFVGGFQIWHGIDILLESFVRVRDEVPGAQLLLVGDGPERGSIEGRVRDLGLNSSVAITGLVPQHRVPAILEISEVAVLPYPRLPREMWFSPLKLYEYMAAGKAIVASRSGQTAEVVQDCQTGLLVEPGDPRELARAVVSLLKDPSKREELGRNARRAAQEKHSWDQYVKRVISIYRQVLN